MAVPTFWCIFLWRHTTPEIEVKSSSDIAALGTVLLISGARIATVTPEKSPHAKTAYWKCLWATVYVNSRLSVLAAVWALSDLLVLQHSFHTQTLYKAAKPLRTPTALGEGEKFVKTQTNWHQETKKQVVYHLAMAVKEKKRQKGGRSSWSTSRLTVWDTHPALNSSTFSLLTWWMALISIQPPWICCYPSGHSVISLKW